MSEAFSTAFSLLVIGMITVFVVLTLVVLTGNLLIRFVNRFLPATGGPPHTEAGSGPAIAAITATVDTVTKGKGTITKIERENE